jgi:hypothetical protein
MLQFILRFMLRNTTGILPNEKISPPLKRF